MKSASPYEELRLYSLSAMRVSALHALKARFISSCRRHFIEKTAVLFFH